MKDGAGAAASEAEAASLVALAVERQRAYAAGRKAWARAVGRPYQKASDPRPPPGEVDADVIGED
ncbi:MAG: hypothetical protein JOZ27_03940 [Caulobacteraceae bacterium]|nr:hypothetical protein [Caulobacteraceae bacterium]